MLSLQLEIAQRLIANTPIETVYIGVGINKKDGKALPTYPTGSGFEYVGLDDTKGLFAYIRNIGEWRFEMIKPKSCGYLYNIAIPLRLVVVGVNRGLELDNLILKIFDLLNPKTLIQRAIVEPDQLFALEQAGIDSDKVFFNQFDNYFAVDFQMFVTISSSACVELNCNLENYKICK